ncbi:hypothetical protein D9619_002251 [Psilocybe cf. subviscida]|uniref:Nephrocystin 3-like N-terminal domain-containing protein n=1 Tax=Psilocybe cf. subviscida TaxID=2480587 RepID=A0A8H5F3Q3_9AGAR|nr:hypothetical protein D9619_002251 [Psilocybe cf. subviscida]
MFILQSATHAAILGASLVAAASGNAVNINNGGPAEVSSAFKKLSGAAAHTALHDSSARCNASRCHQNTRTKYLDNLELWMLGEGGDYEGNRFIWLHGGAGVGKSAIMQSIVERCTQHGVILGTFFFSRMDISRNFAEVLIPTLAYQLAGAFPEAMAILAPIIHRDPLIFTASLRTQVRELLVRPILYLVDIGVIGNTVGLRRVFVIDGLDECSDPQQQALVIEVVASMLNAHHIPFHFLISSRFEVAISNAFQKASGGHESFASISLDHDYDATSDIGHFIADSFRDIVKLHPLRADIPENWPSPRAIDNLKWRTSGLFIHAATVMKFIASPDGNPARLLQVVEELELSPMGNPFGQPEELYLHFLTSAKYTKEVHRTQTKCTCTKLDYSPAEVLYVTIGILLVSAITVIGLAFAAKKI